MASLSHRSGHHVQHAIHHFLKVRRNIVVGDYLSIFTKSGQIVE